MKNYVTDIIYELGSKLYYIKKKRDSKKAFEKYIKENPEEKVCFTCFGYCGQCGGDGHFKPLKEFKNSIEYKSGWPSLIESLLNK